MRSWAARRLLPPITVVAAMVGCGPAAEEQPALHTGPAVMMLDRIEQVRRDLEHATPIVEAAVEADGAKPASHEVAVAYEWELPELGERALALASEGGTPELADCAAFVRHGALAPSPSGHVSYEEDAADIQYALARCGALRRLVVLRPIAVVDASRIRFDPESTETATRAACVPDAPTAASSSAPDEPSADAPDASSGAGAPDAGAANASAGSSGEGAPPPTHPRRCVFDGGYLKAEAHVYALDPVRHLGGFTVEVASAEDAEFIVPSQHVNDEMHALRVAFREALVTALNRYVR